MNEKYDSKPQPDPNEELRVELHALHRDARYKKERERMEAND